MWLQGVRSVRTMRFQAPLVVVLACGAAFLAGCLCPGQPPVGAAAERPARPAAIHFVDLGGVRDWRAEGSEALLIQGADGTWYRATFYGPCFGLQFRERLAFVTDGMNQIDRFSSVLVDRERCWFRTFDRVEEPTS